MEPKLANTRPLAAGRWPLAAGRWPLARGLAMLVGTVLLAAAGLKLAGLNVTPYAQFGWLLNPTTQTAAIVWEVLLGAWLIFNSLTQISKPLSTLAWLAAVLTFAAFAIVSGYLGIIGQANCGCFGVIQASPWAAFGVDVTALAVLAVARPLWSGWTTEVGVLKWAGGMAIALALLAGLGVAAYGSLEVAVAKLRGESLGTTPTALDFGSGKSGELLTTSVTVRNYTDRPVRLIGGTSDCSCITTQDMPVTIEPGQSATIGVKLKVPSSTAGQMTKRVELFTDCPKQRTLRLTAGCRVVE